MDKLSRSTNHQINLLQPSTLHINKRCSTSFWHLISFIFLSLIMIGYGFLGLSLESLHTCERKTVFSSWCVDQIWLKFQEVEILEDQNFKRSKFQKTKILGGWIWPTSTLFDFGFVRETFVWVGCCFGHKNRGNPSTGLTSVDCPSFGQQVDFNQQQFNCVFGVVQGLFLQAIRGLVDQKLTKHIGCPFQLVWPSLTLLI